MTGLEILPVGAVIVSTKTGGMLMRSPNGWIHTTPGTVHVGIPVSEDIFVEAERVAV
jgi:hypothetical protein